MKTEKPDIEKIAKEDQERWYADLRKTIEEMQEQAFVMGFEDVAPDSHLEDLYEWQQSGDDY